MSGHFTRPTTNDRLQNSILWILLQYSGWSHIVRFKDLRCLNIMLTVSRAFELWYGFHCTKAKLDDIGADITASKSLSETSSATCNRDKHVAKNILRRC